MMSSSYPLLERNSNDQGKKLTAASSILFKHVVRACSTLRVCKSDDGGICLLLQRITSNRWSHWSRHCCNQTGVGSDLHQKAKVRETPDLQPPDSSQQEENSEKTAEAWQFNEENLGIKISNGFLFNITVSHVNASRRPATHWKWMFYFQQHTSDMSKQAIFNVGMSLSAI